MGWSELFNRKISFTYRTAFLLLAFSPPAVVFLFFLFRSDNAPAWVQAIGSIAAVIGAGSFPYIHAKRVELEAKSRRLHILSLVLKELSQEVDLIAAVFSGTSGSPSSVTRAYGESFKRRLQTGEKISTEAFDHIRRYINSQRKLLNDSQKAAWIEQRHAMLQSLVLEGHFNRDEAKHIFNAIDACRHTLFLLRLGSFFTAQESLMWGRLALNCSGACRNASKFISEQISPS